mmetsp:Transcript_19565/g.45734  ORF Transcript_19565/g.45734 Transcript_19565/m.45734 type:complete len:266 (+) Transcript_19565:1063-1860(+)
MLVRKSNFNVNLHAPGAQQRLVQHVLSIGHANEQNVVERFNTVDFGQELIDYTVVRACAVPTRPTSLADRIQLVKDDHVQLTVIAAFLVLGLRFFEKVAHVFLTLPHVLVEDLGTVDNLRLFSHKHLSNLPRDQGLAAPWRTIQQHALDVLEIHLGKQGRGENAGSKRSSKHIRNFTIQTADAHLLKAELRSENVCGHIALWQIGELDDRVLFLPKSDLTSLAHDCQIGFGNITLLDFGVEHGLQLVHLNTLDQERQVHAAKVNQ